MRVLVTGSRSWTDVAAIRTAIGMVAEVHGTKLTIVHGGARGADAIADRVARGWGGGMEPEVHRADWDRYRKSAGHRRNAEMVAAGAAVVLAFPIGTSAGTRGCMRAARLAGIYVADSAHALRVWLERSEQ